MNGHPARRESHKQYSANKLGRGQSQPKFNAQIAINSKRRPMTAGLKKSLNKKTVALTARLEDLKAKTTIGLSMKTILNMKNTNASILLPNIKDKGGVKA
jgi:hypothetical protein